VNIKGVCHVLCSFYKEPGKLLNLEHQRYMHSFIQHSYPLTDFSALSLQSTIPGLYHNLLMKHFNCFSVLKPWFHYSQWRLGGHQNIQCIYTYISNKHRFFSIYVHSETLYWGHITVLSKWAVRGIQKNIMVQKCNQFCFSHSWRFLCLISWITYQEFMRTVISRFRALSYRAS
jgi:hypothetical protein